jgi:hypothetical protein
MPLRPLGPGEWGEVSVSRSPSGSLYRARAWFRDFDGVRRMVERDARTEWAARTALETALAERARRGAGNLRGSDTFAAAAALWLERVERLARLGQRSRGTVETYSRQLNGCVLPALGALRLQEVTTPLVDRFVTDVHEHVGPATGRTCRSIVRCRRIRRGSLSGSRCSRAGYLVHCPRRSALDGSGL